MTTVRLNRKVIPREGVERSLTLMDVIKELENGFVIPREGVESSSLSGYFECSFDERVIPREGVERPQTN